jgi:hypothetical protein
MKYKTETDPNSTKRKEKQTHFIAVAAVLFLLLATTSYFVATKGFDYVKDTGGHPTNYLRENGSEVRTLVAIETLKCLKELI